MQSNREKRLHFAVNSMTTAHLKYLKNEIDLIIEGRSKPSRAAEKLRLADIKKIQNKIKKMERGRATLISFNCPLKVKVNVVCDGHEVNFFTMTEDRKIWDQYNAELEKQPAVVKHMSQLDEQLDEITSEIEKLCEKYDLDEFSIWEEINKMYDE